MKEIIIILICCLPFVSFSQSGSTSVSKTTTPEETIAREWIKDLYEMGVEMDKDSIKISDEFKKVMADENYRKTIYPEKYSWQEAVYLMQTQELKKAFWFFINLYPESDQNKELVVKSILTYDQVLEMDKIMVSTFYTYSFMDPEIGIFKDGKPEITRPDILEQKLRVVKEIVGYIHLYRNKL